MITGSMTTKEERRTKPGSYKGFSVLCPKPKARDKREGRLWCRPSSAAIEVKSKNNPLPVH